MTEYIDKVNALSYLKEKYNEMNGMSAWYYAGFQHAVGLLENVRKSDVSKVVHGKWIADMTTTLETVKCSACKKVFQAYYSDYQYCPRCGAKMEK